MSALAALVLTFAAAIPGATGDRTTNLGPAVEVTPTTAHAAQPFARNATPRAPRRITGWAPWTCRRTPARIACATSRTGVLSGSASYTATRRASSVVVDAWRTGRVGR